MICLLLFLAATLNYIDRQIIGLLKPLLTAQLHWSERDYGNIVFAFQLAYAIGLGAAGRLLDSVGVKKGFSAAVALWSLAAIAHGWARSTVSFCVARFGLGLAEAGNFPASIKCVAEWFPRKERALATGIFNSGTNIGALITPLLVPWLAQRFGWPAAFFVTGSLGALWLGLWWIVYETPARHPRLSKAERACIQADPAEPGAAYPWLKLFRHRQLWAFAAGKFITDPWWWFYLFWIPAFLNDRFNIQVAPKEMGPPVLTIYLLASVGSILGGWISSALLQRGHSPNFSRKTAFVLCAIAVVPIIFASSVRHLWAAVFLIGLAAAAHQGFSANLFTLVSDTVPSKAVSSVVGIGGMAGAVGGMVIAEFVGYILDVTHKNYRAPFVMAGFAYLLAALVIHLLLPRLEPMESA